MVMVNPEGVPQLENALTLISLTLSPMVMFDRFLQPANASVLINFTLLGMVRLVKPVQSMNALIPIVVTLLGMVMLVKPVQFMNPFGAICVTGFPLYSAGIITLPVAPSLLTKYAVPSPVKSNERPG